jgi:photosystem II stability/assembly factor-like uncharacterized protein
VIYSAALHLNDVFFITPDIGWVAGNAGTILHTQDGGTTWTAQLGGDPAAQDPPIQWIRFIDEKHGWAMQHYGILLRTSDGENWERIGSDVRGDVTFLSPTTGFRAYSTKIHRTRDAGRTWQEVFTCRAKMQVAGLARDVNCNLESIYFPSPSVGYAVGEKRIVAKTVDGGGRWTVLVGPEEPGDQRAQEVFFLDENVGFQRRWSALYRTMDGGTTWTGVVASGGFGPIRFADPEVGWSFAGASVHGDVFTYTTDGGKRWTTRQAEFPTPVTGLSAPRRDRAYVVGDHGMIYRYRLVPAIEPAPAQALAGPALPVFDSPLDDQVETVEEQVDALGDQLEAQIEQAAAPPGDPTAAADPAPALVENCCAPAVDKLQATVDALTPLMPQFVRKYRNINLVVAGLQLLGVFPDHLAQVKAALQKLRKSKGTAATTAALVELDAAVKALGTTTRQAFQQQPMQVETGAAPEQSSGGAAADAAGDAEPGDSAAGAVTDTPLEVEETAKQKAGEAAKKQLGKAKKKIKVRFP